MSNTRKLENLDIPNAVTSYVTYGKHAVRIARYLYPQAYLSAASAALLGPTRGGRLFFSGRRIQGTRLRALEIIQNKAPDHASVARPQSMMAGEFTVSVSAPRQRFLEAFRIRNEHAASLDEGMRSAIAQRVWQRIGGGRRGVGSRPPGTKPRSI
jgi:serine/threonine-protein kinase HipA